jgi:hypothetical protein
MNGPIGFAEVHPAISPDGKWLASQSDESGRFEVYIRPYPEVTRGRWQVSPNGGTSPAWRRDGREIVFAAGSVLTAVDFAGGGSPRLGTPRRLFTVISSGERLAAHRAGEPEAFGQLPVAARGSRDGATPCCHNRQSLDECPDHQSAIGNVAHSDWHIASMLQCSNAPNPERHNAAIHNHPMNAPIGNLQSAMGARARSCRRRARKSPGSGASTAMRRRVSGWGNASRQACSSGRSVRFALSRAGP